MKDGMMIFFHLFSLLNKWKHSMLLHIISNVMVIFPPKAGKKMHRTIIFFVFHIHTYIVIYLCTYLYMWVLYSFIHSFIYFISLNTPQPFYQPYPITRLRKRNVSWCRNLHTHVQHSKAHTNLVTIFNAI